MPAPLDAGQDFGAAFRAQRRAAGFTQAALAQRAGCRRQTIVAIEAGQNIELCTLLAALAAMGKELRIGDARGDFEDRANRDRLRKRKIKHVKPVAVVATV